MKKLLIILALLLLSGCVNKITYQVDGQPILDNVITSRILSTNIKLKYTVINNFTITEDDESYLTQKALNLTPFKINKIEKSKSLIFRLYVFNPDKIHYRIKTYTLKKGEKELIEKLYDGNLSRNEYVVELPINVKSEVSFYFKLLNEKNELMFKSFNVRYKVAKSK